MIMNSHSHRAIAAIACAFDRHALELHRDLVEDDQQGDARDHGREQEDDRHQRRRPPRVGLEGAEEEADVAVQQAGHRDADGGEHPGDLSIDGLGLWRGVVDAEGEDGKRASA